MIEIDANEVLKPTGKDSVLLSIPSATFDRDVIDFIETRVMEMIPKEVERLVLSFADVDHLDGDGLRGLLELRETAEKRNLKLVLRHMTTSVYKALKLSGHAWEFVVDHGD
ncbi:MAG: STAS domain-containing protein [Acidobacteriota bacterium]